MEGITARLCCPCPAYGALPSTQPGSRTNAGSSASALAMPQQGQSLLHQFGPGFGLSPGSCELNSNLDSVLIHPEVSRVFMPFTCSRREVSSGVETVLRECLPICPFWVRGRLGQGVWQGPKCPAILLTSVEIQSRRAAGAADGDKQRSGKGLALLATWGDHWCPHRWIHCWAGSHKWAENRKPQTAAPGTLHFHSNRQPQSRTKLS